MNPYEFDNDYRSNQKSFFFENHSGSIHQMHNLDSSSLFMMQQNILQGQSLTNSFVPTYDQNQQSFRPFNLFNSQTQTFPSVMNGYQNNPVLSTNRSGIEPTMNYIRNDRFIPEPATIILPNEEIQDVSMVDDINYDVDNIAYDNQITASDPFKQDSYNHENSYWNCTKDCDYRLLQTTDSNTLNESIVSIEKQLKKQRNSAKKNLTRCRSSKKQCRKLGRRKCKKKAIKMDENFIDLTKSSKKDSLEEYLDFDDIDNMNFSSLLKYHDQLKNEIEALNDSSSISDNDDQDLCDNKHFDSVKQSIGSGINLIDNYSDRINHEATNSVETNRVAEKEGLKIVATDSTEKIDASDSSGLNENMLREQLIRKLLVKRFSDAPNESDIAENSNQAIMVEDNQTDSIVASQSQNEIQYELEKNLTNSIASTNTVGQENFSGDYSKNSMIKFPEIDWSQYTLVIRINPDSDDDDNDEESHIENSATKKQDEKNFSLSNRKDLEHIRKLLPSQQEEYQKLIKEIERRESFETKMKSLKIHEAELQEKICAKELHRKSLKCFNHELRKLRNESKRSELILQKAKRTYLIARKNHQNNLLQMQSMIERIEETNQSLLEHNQSIRNIQKVCLNMGKKIIGDNYKLSSMSNPSPKKRSIEMVKKKHLKKKYSSLSIKIKTRMQSMRNLRMKIVKILSRSSTSVIPSHHQFETIKLFDHTINFDFSIIRFSQFIQSSPWALDSRNDGGIRFRLESSSSLITQLTLSNHHENSEEFSIEKFNDRNYESVLEHFRSFRFSKQSLKITSQDFVSNKWSHLLDPNKIVCHFDLNGKCSDKDCQFQHQNDYILTSKEKIIDLLSFSSEFGSQINLKELRKNPKLLDEKISDYIKMNREFETIETISSEVISTKVINDRKQQSKTGCFLIPFFPRNFIKYRQKNRLKLRIEVPYDDYHYSFDLRDDSFRLKLSEMFRKTQNHPDSFVKNRFFAPDGIPITARLESYLAQNPHHIETWIDLAYYHLSKIVTENDCELADQEHCFNSALNVLSRALELNQKNVDLYDQYLLFYSNRSRLLMDETSPSVQEICRRILNHHCSSYKIWIRYLNLNDSFGEKNSIIDEILEKFVSEQIVCENSEERSKNLLEIILNRINLLLHSNLHQESLRFFNEIFSHQERIVVKSDKSLIEHKIGALILPEHSLFAWQCYVYLIINQNLPYHCFRLNERGNFLSLINTDPLIFEWKKEISIKDLHMIRRIFKRALKNFHTANHRSDEKRQTNIQCCFVLQLNLINLNKILFNARQSRNTERLQLDHCDDDFGDDDDSQEIDSFSSLFNAFKTDLEILNDLHILYLFEANLLESGQIDSLKMLNLIEHFHGQSIRRVLNDRNQLADGSKSDISIGKDSLPSYLKFNFWLAFFKYKNNDVEQSIWTLSSSISFFYDDLNLTELNLNDRIKLYETILFDSLDFDDLVIIKTIPTGRDCGDNEDFSIDSSYKSACKKKSKLVESAPQQIYLYLSYL